MPYLVTLRPYETFFSRHLSSPGLLHSSLINVLMIISLSECAPLLKLCGAAAA